MSNLSPEIAKAESQCAVAGNDVLSCYPTNSTETTQGQTVSFVWNSRNPIFTQTNLVDVHVFRDTDGWGIYSAIGVVNPTNGTAGMMSIPVSDAWFNDAWNGVDISTPFYFTIAPSGTVPRAQATFRALQTGPVPTHPYETASIVPGPFSTATGSTASESAPREMPSVSAGAIAGIAIGSVAGLALVGLGTWLLLRRRRRAAAARPPGVVLNLGSETGSVVEYDEKASMRGLVLAGDEMRAVGGKAV